MTDEPKLIETVSLYQSAEKIYTKSFSGVYRNLRLCGAGLLFLLYFGTVWLQWGGRQAVLWDLPTRQFHIFGATFLPQDFILLSFILIISAFGLFFITVLAGRIWCGYTCPQSVFTWVFMWVEKVTEGDRHARIRLDNSPTNSQKITRKVAKHAAWLLISFVVGVTFVGYFTPIQRLVVDLATVQLSGWALFWVLFFTLATYANAGWLREQVCFHMCPYARFQSVMYDRDTIAVHYDATRGEPRGARKPGKAQTSSTLGDCIDCQMCVQVCPTGIDIREGLQYECINCGACVDACDTVMDKIGYEPGLIRYTNENTLAGQTSRIVRPRLIGYLAVLGLAIAAFIYTLIGYSTSELDVLRDRQSLFMVDEAGNIENVYTLKIVNKSQQVQTLLVHVSGLAQVTVSGLTSITVAPQEVASLPLRLVVPPNALTQSHTNVTFSVKSDLAGGPEASTESRFLSPGGR